MNTFINHIKIDFLITSKETFKHRYIHLIYVLVLLNVPDFWTAPEVIRSEKNVDVQKGDIFALGIIFKEVFTRSTPYSEYGFMTSEGRVGYLNIDLFFTPRWFLQTTGV